MRRWCLLLSSCSLLGCAERLSPLEPSGRLHGNVPRRWATLLTESTSPTGRVDYDNIRRQRDILDRYMAWAAVHGPESDRMSYTEEDKKIAMLANAYNAAVIYAVLERWPLDSVRDVKLGLFRSPPGAGFFLGQEFRIDGEWVSLYFLEHQYLLGNYEDPFIHVMLNCASQGCPPPRYWEDEDLDRQQEDALRAYLASPRGLRQTDTGGWAVSELFLWFEDQLVDWSDADDLCAFLAPYAPGGAARGWLEGRQGHCTLDTFPYDWSLNVAEGAP